MATVIEQQTSSVAPRAGVLTAMRRHWIVALVPLVILVAAAVALGLKRTPQYTADADVSVSQLYVSNPAAVGSVIQGTESLASVYSRAIHADAVTQAVSRELRRRGLSPTGSLSATPVPSSPLIKVTATSDSAQAAMTLANAGGTALANYANKRTRAGRQASRLSSRYKREALTYRKLVAARDKVLVRFGHNPTQKNQNAVARATAAVDTARMRRDALVAGYQGAVEGDVVNSPVSLFSSATSARSDRHTVLEILVFAGVLAGLAAGAALALLLSLRDARRRPVA